MKANQSAPHMMRASELPFDVPPSLANDIDEYIAAYKRDDWRLDMFTEILYQSAGSISEFNRCWLIDYYTDGGWERGMEYSDVA